MNGDTGSDANGFDGLGKLIGAGAQQVTGGTNGAKVSLAKLDELIDTVLGEKPGLLLCSKRRRLRGRHRPSLRDQQPVGVYTLGHITYVEL